MKYKDCESAREYLEFVLKYWEAWAEHNGGLSKAIREILDENRELKSQLIKLQAEVKK